MSQGSFDFVKAKDLYENGQLKDRLDCKNYILKFFYPTYDGNHVVFNNAVPKLVKNEEFTRVYLNRLPKDIKKFYITETIPFNVICNPLKPVTGKDFVNMSPQFKHAKKPFKDFSQKTKDSIQVFLDYIKLIWCDNNEEVYWFIVYWLANVVKGVKNKSCIYAVGPEGIGKSTLTEYFRDWVIGSGLTIEGKEKHLTSVYNMGLLGKVLVCFEELPVFSDRDWKFVDSTLKTKIADKMDNYEDKHVKSFQAENINNYIIPTNFGSIKGSNGRRYLVCDMNVSKKDDYKYFKNIREKCFNDEVACAMYNYLIEIDTSNFDSFKVPMTKAKRLDISNKLPLIQKFLKLQYLLRKKAIDASPTMLLDELKSYCERNEIKCLMTKPAHICKGMRSMGFDYVKVNGYSRYKISLSQLEDTAKKFNWRHDMDKDELRDDMKKCKYDLDEVIDCEFKERDDALKIVSANKIRMRKLEIDNMMKELEIRSLKRQLENVHFEKRSEKIQRSDNFVDSFF